MVRILYGLKLIPVPFKLYTVPFSSEWCMIDAVDDLQSDSHRSDQVTNPGHFQSEASQSYRGRGDRYILACRSFRMRIGSGFLLFVVSRAEIQVQYR